MDITAEVVEKLSRKLREEHRGVGAALAKIAQRRAAAQLGQDRKAMNGLGRVRMEVATEAYHYWGQRLGYKCWRDEAFLREFERDNEDARVRCAGTKLQFGYTPAGDSPRVKFHKTYAHETKSA
jgi:hypothetical protein